MSGAPPLPPLTRIADWTILEVLPRRHAQIRWRVRCEGCGVEGERYAADIVAGRSSRCGDCSRVHELLAIRKRARSKLCPVCRARVNRPCRDVPSAAFEWGTHVERARLAGCPPLPSVAELNGGVMPTMPAVEAERSIFDVAGGVV